MKNESALSGEPSEATRDGMGCLTFEAFTPLLTSFLPTIILLSSSKVLSTPFQISSSSFAGSVAVGARAASMMGSLLLSSAIASDGDSSRTDTGPGPGEDW